MRLPYHFVVYAITVALRKVSFDGRARRSIVPGQVVRATFGRGADHPQLPIEQEERE